MSPNFFRFTIQKRNPFDSEIGNCIEKKSDSSPPRYYPSAFSAPSFLPENSILVVFVLLFLATVFPFPFPQLRPISENYTFSLPSPDLSLSTRKKKKRRKPGNEQRTIALYTFNLVWRQIGSSHARSSITLSRELSIFRLGCKEKQACKKEGSSGYRPRAAALISATQPDGAQ